jgi:RHS repeat-associated protein
MSRPDASGVVCYDADFYPYGGERTYTNTCPQNYKFEGKERDSESGLDNFGARYYSNRFGRWLSADWSAVPVPVPYANLTNPQTLNLYSMVADDPESFADLDGHDVQDITLLISGPNNVPNTPHPEVTDASTLGPKDERSGGYYALNTQSVFDSGDNPSDYKTIRSAYILNGEGNVSQTRTGAEENPAKSQTAVNGSSKFVFDSPGVSVEGGPKAVLFGKKIDTVYSVQEQNRKTGEVSAPTLYYRVQVGYTKDGKLVTQVNTITRDQFLKLTGQNRKKDKKNKEHNQ